MGKVCSNDLCSQLFKDDGEVCIVTRMKCRVVGILLAWMVFSSVASAKTNTSTALSSSSNPSTYGSSVTFTATVTPSAATGTVTFKDGSTTLGTGTLSGGKTTFSTSTLAAGSHSITAAYGGNTTYNSSTSSTLTQTVNKANTTVTLASSANPSTYGASVTFTATVSPSAATGTVTFKDGSATLGTGTLSSGKATFSTSTLTAGSHSITAAYGGATNYNSSTSSALTQTVNKANTTLTLASSKNPSTYGSSVTFTATVSPSAATGTVTFKDGSTTLGTGTVSSGKATFSTSTLIAGSHSITAVYGGDTNYNTSTSSALTQTVNKATTTVTLTSSSNPSAAGVSVTFTATVSPSAATGTVTFKDGSTTLGTGTLSSGIATFSTSTLALGSHSITASYGGDTNDNTSTSSTLTQQVEQPSSITVSSSTNPAPVSATVTFTAVVTPSAATGTVTFMDGSTSLGTGSLSAGTAAFSTSGLAAGSHSITAVYGGSSTDVGSTSSVLTQSILTLTSISLSPLNGSAPVGATQQFTATATFSNGTNGNITASVAWTSSATTVATISSLGVATILEEGPTTIQAAVGTVNSSTTLTGSPSRFRFTGDLITARDTFTATVLQSGKVLIVGGTGSGLSIVGTCELYDPATGTFSATGNLNVPRFNHTATLLNSGLVLIAGGEVSNGSGGFTESAIAELYDPNAGTFSLTGSLNQARKNHTATLLGSGAVLIAGGNGLNGDVATAELYSSTTNSFSTTGNLNTPRDMHTATLLNDGTVLLAGGEPDAGSSALASAEIYSATTGLFTTTGPLNTASVNHTATLLNSGQVLIAGGSPLAFSGALARAELYNPSNDLFTNIGNLTTPRSSFTATLLSTGDVLFVGGVNNSSQVLDTGELYDPTAGAFSLAGNLNVGRGFHSAAPLNNGLVLFAGGLDGESLFLNSAETYQSTITELPPLTLQITPAVVNMVVGGTQQFTAVDNYGFPREDVTWSVSNASLASVTPNANNAAVLTALAAGQVTLTASAEGVTAQEQVTILSQTSFTAGTTIWSALPPAPGFSALQLAQAVPSANGPDLYSISLSADGTQSIIQALMADGEQLWQATVPPLNKTSVPDGTGGLIVTAYQTCASGQTNPMTVVDLDGATGQPLWQVVGVGVNNGNGITYCYPAGTAPQIAVGGDGSAYIVEPTNAGFSPLTKVSPDGAMQTSTLGRTTIILNGQTTIVTCCQGPPMVNTDGNMYLEYEIRNVTNNVITSDALYLYHSDNVLDPVELSTTTQNQALLPGPIIPDGQGGVIATWTISPSNPPVPQFPYQAVDVSNDVEGTPFNLPFSPQTVTFQQSPTLVLGENGVAFASSMTTSSTDGVTQVSQIASFNVSGGAPNWTYQAPAGDTLTIVEATNDGGITINDSNAGVIQLDTTGNSSNSSRAIRLRKSAGIRADDSSSALPPGAVPLDLSTWVAVGSGAANAFWSPDGTNGIPTVLAPSAYPMAQGNTHGQSTTPYCQQTSVNCALAPYSDQQALVKPGILARVVVYKLFTLQNGYLRTLGTAQVPGVKIELWEANSTNSSVKICDWQSNNPVSMCESPNYDDPDWPDPPGQITDKMGAGNSPSFTVQQQFLVDRQGLQVFWPNSAGSWYGAWGTPASTPPNFQPNQTSNTTTGWATISQINANTNAPTACPSGCNTMLPQAGPPTQ
jgi:hypothetical protein